MGGNFLRRGAKLTMSVNVAKLAKGPRLCDAVARKFSNSHHEAESLAETSKLLEDQIDRCK